MLTLKLKPGILQIVQVCVLSFNVFEKKYWFEIGLLEKAFKFSIIGEVCKLYICVLEKWIDAFS